MPSVAAARTKPQLAQGQVDVVADHEEILARQLVKIQHFADAAAAQVHKRLGLDEQHPPWALTQFGHLSREASGKAAGMRAFQQRVDHGIADVMPRARITPAGIAKANDKLGRLKRHPSSPYPLPFGEGCSPSSSS